MDSSFWSWKLSISSRRSSCGGKIRTCHVSSGVTLSRFKTRRELIVAERSRKWLGFKSILRQDSKSIDIYLVEYGADSFSVEFFDQEKHSVSVLGFINRDIQLMSQ